MLTSLESDFKFAKVTGEILPIEHIPQAETSTQSFLQNKCTMLAKTNILTFHYIAYRGLRNLDHFETGDMRLVILCNL